MPEDPLVVTISSSSSISPDEITRKTFPVVKRGVDADAVRHFLEQVASDVRGLLEREVNLRRSLADAERRAADPEIDEATLMRAVGSETARILQTAHDAARDVVEKAEARAAELLAEAEQVAEARSSEAEESARELLATAEHEAATLTEAALAEAAAEREAARREADDLTEAARSDAESLLAATKDECRSMVQEAKQLRSSVLHDLAERRKGLFVQLEQLRSGRDLLVEVVEAVGDAVDDLRERLGSAEHDARVAAAEAGDRAAGEVDDLLELDRLPELEEVADVAEVAEVAAVAEVAEEAIEEALALELAADEGLAGELVGAAGLAEAPSAADAEPETGGRSVDELFAKIRASREDSGVLGQASAHEAAVNEAEDEPQEQVPEAEESEEAVHDADQAALARRTELLSPIETRLSRALKRALQDDQNELLDSLRHASGAPELDGLLPEDQQEKRFETAVSSVLGEAWTVGRGWLVSGDPADPQAADDAGTALARELAKELAGQLRHRLGSSLEAVTDAADPSTQDVASAAYRDWKGARVEGLAGDYATRAFAGGAVSSGAGSVVRWVVDDDGQPCPDCDDNALAGSQPAGEPFPTGQTHPPVHPGCRCLLVAADS
jgi:DivIVA domain-containing protein